MSPWYFFYDYPFNGVSISTVYWNRMDHYITREIWIIRTPAHQPFHTSLFLSVTGPMWRAHTGGSGGDRLIWNSEYAAPHLVRRQLIPSSQILGCTSSLRWCLHLFPFHPKSWSMPIRTAKHTSVSSLSRLFSWTGALTYQYPPICSQHVIFSNQ